MEDVERQQLLAENARLKAEITILKQNIDALCRRVFGKSGEKLDPAQLELFDPAMIAPSAESDVPGPAAEEPARQGFRFDRKTLCDWVALGAHRSAIIYRELQREHWRSCYRQFDETPTGYLKPGSGQAQAGCLWTSNIPGCTVIYHWRTGSDSGGTTELVGDTGDENPSPLACILQCDGYKAYPAWAKDKPWITLVGCHAHVRRRFFETKDQQPKLVAWILRQIGHLYRIETELRKAKAGPALREAALASQSRTVHQRLKRLLDRLALRSILPKSNLGKAIAYALKEWKKLEVFIGDGRVEIDNNLVENAIRPTKLGAKNWLFIGCAQAGQKAAILYTIVEDCRRLGIDTREYLEDVLTRPPGMKASEAVHLTPANWLRARQGKPARKAA